MNIWILIYLLMFLVCYLLGSLSPSILISKRKGKDIIKEGSGNAGSTNVFRVLGTKYAFIVFLLDFIKGFVPVLLITIIMRYLVPNLASMIAYCCSIFIVFGHIFSCFHKFKAGKGVATTFGVLFAVDWRIGLICLLACILLIGITRRVSIGSLTAVMAMPIATFFLANSFFYFSLFLCALLIFTHRKNIVRIYKGEEKRLW